MDVNVNIALVHVESKQEQNTPIPNCKILQNLWITHKYTLIHTNANPNRTHENHREPFEFKASFQIQNCLEKLWISYQNKAFQRVILMGEISQAFVEKLADLAQKNEWFIYIVSDAIASDFTLQSKPENVRWITTQQITTLFKSIKDD